MAGGNIWGMNLEGVEKLAKDFESQAKQLEQIRLSVDTAVRGVAWEGGDRIKFNNNWTNVGAKNLSECQAGIEKSAGFLRAQALEQLKASTSFGDEGAGGGSFSGSGSSSSFDTKGPGFLPGAGEFLKKSRETLDAIDSIMSLGVLGDKYKEIKSALNWVAFGENGIGFNFGRLLDEKLKNLVGDELFEQVTDAAKKLNLPSGFTQTGMGDFFESQLKSGAKEIGQSALKFAEKHGGEVAEKALKTAGELAGAASKALPVVGDVIDAGMTFHDASSEYYNNDPLAGKISEAERNTRAATVAAVTAGLGVAGSVGGAALGGAIGSVIPGPGTAIGAAVGGWVGGEAAKKLMDIPGAKDFVANGGSYLYGAAGHVSDAAAAATGAISDAASTATSAVTGAASAAVDAVSNAANAAGQAAAETASDVADFFNPFN